MKLTTVLTVLAAAAAASASVSDKHFSMGEIRALESKARHSSLAMEKRYTVYKQGQMTYYYGSQLENPYCGGKTPTDNDMVVAVPKGSPAKCGDKVHLHYNGKMVEATVVDRCGGCKNKYSVDATKGVFKKLAALDVGVLNPIHMRVLGQ